MTPIERIFERDGLPHFGLPPVLAAGYGGDFGLARPRLYANFVSSVDGVVALAESGEESGRVISGDSEPDRFVMALLRACADAVLIGAGTFRHAGGSFWRPGSVYPAAAAAFVDLRKKLGLRPNPLLVIVTASGRIDRSQPALSESLIITTPDGEAHLRGALPVGARIAVVDANPIGGGAHRIGGRSVMNILDAENVQAVLTEGGPSLAGVLFREGLVDELFLTTSPRLFGREANDGSKSLVEGVDLAGRALDLLGVRRHESHLFLRYAVARG